VSSVAGRRVTCVLLTYNRLEYAKRTLETFYRHVYPKIPLHIADDGSPQGYTDALIDFARMIGVHSMTVSNSQRGGYGRNVNLAHQALRERADYGFMLEDDWELLKPLKLDELVADMEACPTIECMRLGYLSFTQPLWGGLCNASENRKYLLLDPNSPEPHVFAGHPRLESVRYQREVGEWPEGLSPGETEFAVAHVRRARYGVAWPIGLDSREGSGYFAHIGTVRAW
jgi:glycosyltransferase involved in cell wall biosynthesis